MTSPNEPGYPRSADGPGSANGSIPDDSETGSIGNAMGRGHVTDPGDVPPWQRGPAARAQKAPAPAGAGAHPPRAASRQQPLRPLPRCGCPPEPFHLRRVGPTAVVPGHRRPAAPARRTAAQRPAAQRAAAQRPARATNPHAASRRSARPTPVNSPTCPPASRGPRRASPRLNAASRRREPPPPAAYRWPAGRRPVRSGPACRSAVSTRGARSRFRWCCRWRCSSCG